jgi:hypothetical protein
MKTRRIQNIIPRIPARAIREVAAVSAFAFRKYSSSNSVKSQRWSRCQGILLRHYEEFVKGADLDSESGLHHTAHVAWNALILLTCQLFHLGEDDRKEKDSHVLHDVGGVIDETKRS